MLKIVQVLTGILENLQLTMLLSGLLPTLLMFNFLSASLRVCFFKKIQPWTFLNKPILSSHGYCYYPLDRMLVQCRQSSTPLPPQDFVANHLFASQRCTVRVKCLDQKYSATTLASAQMWTTQSSVQLNPFGH